MRPTPLTKNQSLKVLKATLYVGVSAMIAYIISWIAEDPDLFGALTPIVNVVLVYLRQLFTEETAKSKK